MINKKWENIVIKYLTKKSNFHKNKLVKKNLYIFPNFKGFQLGAFIFFSFTASIFYQNNVGLLISIIFFFIYFISIIISYQNLNNIRAEPLTVLAQRNKNTYLDFTIQALNNRERLNLDISVNDKNIQNIDLAYKKKITFKNLFLKRGVIDIPILKIQSFFPFGIIKTFGVIKFNQKLYVYPEPIKPPLDIIKDLKIKNQFDENDYEFDRIEEAKLGESLSRISWKHYSIKKKLFSKKFINIENHKEILIDIGQLDKFNLELALSYAVYLIEYYYNRKINFALKYKDFVSEYSNTLNHKNNLLKFTSNV